MKVLIIGGTAEAKKIARQLHAQGIHVIYSIAGLVRQPDLDCEVISGGFSQYGGLSRYLSQHSISLVLDATHPYAVKMSTTTVTAAKEHGISCWRYQRPAWQKQTNDHWKMYKNWDELVSQLSAFSRIFLTVGQVNKAMLDTLQKHYQSDQYFLLRTAIPNQQALPSWVQPLQQIGPFSLSDEYELLQENSIDVLVSKNSGGEATMNKLIAARELALPVLMLERPELPIADREFEAVDEVIACVMLTTEGIENTE